MIYLSIGGFLISLIALFVSGYSIYETRQHHRVSTRPKLVGQRHRGPFEFRYEIANKGLGPAYFKKVEYFERLEPLEGRSFTEAVSSALRAAELFDSVALTTTELPSRAVMAPGDSDVLGHILLANRSNAGKFQEFLDTYQIDIRITYQSAHGETDVWATDDTLLPKSDGADE